MRTRRCLYQFIFCLRAGRPTMLLFTLVASLLQYLAGFTFSPIFIYRWFFQMGITHWLSRAGVSERQLWIDILRPTRSTIQSPMYTFALVKCSPALPALSDTPMRIEVPGPVRAEFRIEQLAWLHCPSVLQPVQQMTDLVIPKPDIEGRHVVEAKVVLWYAVVPRPHMLRKHAV